MSPATIEIYRRALGIPADATHEQAVEYIRAIAASCSPNFRTHNTSRASCTQGATMANPPPIDRRTSHPSTLDARRRAHMALAVDWRNQPALTSEIAERILAMAVAGDLLEFITSISDADLADLYKRMCLSSRTKQAAEALYAAAGLRAMAERYARPLAHLAPPASPEPELPTAGQLSSRERAMCLEFGTSEATYLRLRSERDRKLDAQKLAKEARRKADREAAARHVATLRGAK